MRNLKKLLAVIVAICVLATFTVPAFAETKTDAQVCTDLGMVVGAGSGVTAEYLATQPTRLQGAIMFLRLKGLEDEAKAFIGTDNFADVSALNDTNQAILAYLKANPDLGFAGIGDNKFAPAKIMTAKEYYKVLLVALGYVDGTDFTWATVFQVAASKGIYKLVDNEKFTVNDLTIGTVEALKATVKGGTDTLLAALVADGSIASGLAVASGLYSAVAKALEIVSASATNLKTAMFVFNKELDSKTVVKDNFSSTNVSDVKLLDDNKTVVFILSTEKLKQNDKEEITVKNVKATDGTALAEVKKEVFFVDTTFPTISGVVATNPKTLVIATSEPLKYAHQYNTLLSDIKIDGAAQVGRTTIDYAKNTVTVIYANAMAAGTRKVALSGLVDYANYPVVAQEYNVEVVEDKTAPSIVSAKMNTTKEVEVVFNEEIVDNGEFQVDNTNAVAAVKQADGKTFKLTLAADLGIGATVEIKVTYKNQTDVMGNKVEASTNYAFKVTDDTALPTVTAAIASDNKITLTFSKSMSAGGTIKILKASDSSQLKAITVVGATFKSDSNYTIIELDKNANGLAGLDATAIKVNIKDMKDGSVRKNALVEQNLTLTSFDGKAPTIIAYYTVTAGATSDDDYATFRFSEAMDADSLKNLSNYTATGIKSGNLAVMSGVKVKEVNAKDIKITIPGIATTATANGTTFTIIAVKDVAGNTAATLLAPIGNNAPAFAVNGASVKAESNKKIKVTFTSQINTIDPRTFVVKSNTTGGAVTASFYSASISDDLYSATFETASDLGTTFGAILLQVYDNAAAKDIFGNALVNANTNTFNIIDGVKPTAKIEVDDAAGSIKITFSEDVMLALAGDLNTDMILRDKDGVLVTTPYTVSYSLDGVASTFAGFDKIVISGLATLKEYSVEFIGSTIKDSVGKVLAPAAKTTITTKE